MKYRQFFTEIFFILSIILSAAILISAQTGPDVLATAGGMSFTSVDLTRAARAAYENSRQSETTTRQTLLDTMTNDLILEEEAKLRKITVDQLIEAEVAKRVPNPTDAQV